jgi:hypothetical protein
LVSDRLGQDQHGLEFGDARNKGEVDTDELRQMSEVAQGEYDDHVELTGHVIAGTHAIELFDAILELPDGALAMFAQLRDDDGVHRDAQGSRVDDGAVTADSAAAFEATHSPQHRRRGKAEGARQGKVRLAPIAL